MSSSAEENTLEGTLQKLTDNPFVEETKDDAIHAYRVRLIPAHAFTDMTIVGRWMKHHRELILIGAKGERELTVEELNDALLYGMHAYARSPSPNVVIHTPSSMMALLKGLLPSQMTILTTNEFFNAAITLYTMDVVQVMDALTVLNPLPHALEKEDEPPYTSDEEELLWYYINSWKITCRRICMDMSTDSEKAHTPYLEGPENETHEEMLDRLTDWLTRIERDLRVSRLLAEVAFKIICGLHRFTHLEEPAIHKDYNEIVEEGEVVKVLVKNISGLLGTLNDTLKGGCPEPFLTSRYVEEASRLSEDDRKVQEMDRILRTSFKKLCKEEEGDHV